jgi:hypothetical protein
MDDKLLNEISRFRKLSGLALINEQGGSIDNLLSLAGKRIKNLDDFIDALNLTGKNLTDDQIGSLVDEMVDAGAMLPKSGILLKQELKANAKLRSALSNRSEDFVSAVKNAGKKENLVGLWGVHILNKSQVLVVYTKLVKQFLDVAGSNTQSMFNSIDNEFASYLQQIYDSGIGLHSIDEVWDVIDGNILEHVNTSGFSPELAEAHFKEFSKKIKEGSKTKEILDKINAEGRNAGKPKRTTPVTEYKQNYKVPEEWAGTPKKLIHRDEAGKTIKYSDSTPIKVDGDNLPAKVDDGGLPSTIEDVEEVFDEYELIDDGVTGTPPPVRDPIPNGVPDRKFFNNFFFKYCKLGFCEVIINLLRSIGKSPQDFVDDMVKTQDKIIELTGKLEKMNPGDSGYFSVKFELDGYINRLKSNAKMMSTPTEGFATQWGLIKDQIKQTLGAERSQLANDIINYCETKAITSGGETITGLNPIENFMELMTKHTDEGAMGGFILDIRKIATPEYWASLKNTGLVKYFNDDVKKYYDSVRQQNKNRVTAVINSIGKVALDFLIQLFLRFANYMTYGTFRYYKDIMKRLSKGNFTSMSGIKRYAALYVEIALISNVITPFLDYVVDTFKNIIESLKLYDFEENEKSPEDALIEDLVQRIPIIGNDFEWNPFFNPIGFVPGVGEVGELLGFERAPLPQSIIDLGALIYKTWRERGKEKTGARDVAEERKRIAEAEFQRKTNEGIEKLNSAAVTKYNLNKEGVEKSNGKEDLQKIINVYSNTQQAVQLDKNFDLMLPTDTEKILNALTFTPGVPPDVENQVLGRERNKKRSVVDDTGKLIGIYYPDAKIKFVPNSLGEADGYKSSETIPKDSKISYPEESTMLSELSNISGYWSLKAKDGKLYLLKKQGGYLFFVTPSVDEIRKNPNKQLVMNDLQKFVPYLP